MSAPVAKFVITNSVLSAESMGRLLGIGKKRVDQVRVIMAARKPRKKVQ